MHRREQEDKLIQVRFFLAVQDSSIGDLVTDSVSAYLRSTKEKLTFEYDI